MPRTPARTFDARKRRAAAVVAGALIAAPMLSSCTSVRAAFTGFDVSTDQVYVPANGANFRTDAPINVLGLVVVSAQEGSGTLIGKFVNARADETATTPEIDPVDDDVAIEGYEPFELGPNETENLAEENLDPIIVTGDAISEGGNVSLEFSVDGVTTRINVPVVPDAEDIEIPAPLGEEHGEGDLHEIGEQSYANYFAGLDRSGFEEAPTIEPAPEPGDETTEPGDETETTQP